MHRYFNLFWNRALTLAVFAVLVTGLAMGAASASASSMCIATCQANNWEQAYNSSCQEICDFAADKCAVSFYSDPSCARLGIMPPAASTPPSDRRRIIEGGTGLDFVDVEDPPAQPPSQAETSPTPPGTPSRKPAEGRNQQAERARQGNQQAREQQSEQGDQQAEGGEQNGEQQQAESDQQSPGQQQPGAPTQSGPVGSDDVAFYEQQLRECEQTASRAKECCMQPMKCMAGINLNSAEATMITTLLGGGVQGFMAAKSNNPEGVKKACGIMKTMGFAAAGMNATSAMTCANTMDTCKSTCAQIRQQLEQAISQCGGTGNTNQCGSSVTSRLNSVKLRAEGRIGQCEEYQGQVALLSQQAVQSGFSGQMASLCGQASTTAATGFDDIDKQPVYNPDCLDPANANNPACAHCRGPEAASNPLCNGTNVGTNQANNGGSGFSNRSADYGGANGDGAGVNLGDLGDGGQQGVAGGASIGESQNKGVPNNGGGFRGSTAASGGGPVGGGGGAGQGPGYDTDVLQGASGGGGYSVNQGGGFVSGGGFSGYGTQAGKKTSPFSKFNLGQYLPGGKKDPKRNIAGVGTHGRADIGPAHEDIFSRISNRVKVICKLKRLYDCR